LEYQGFKSIGKSLGFYTTLTIGLVDFAGPVRDGDYAGAAVQAAGLGGAFVGGAIGVGIGAGVGLFTGNPVIGLTVGVFASAGISAVFERGFESVATDVISYAEPYIGALFGYSDVSENGPFADRDAVGTFGGFSAGSLVGSASGSGTGLGVPSVQTAGSFSLDNGVQFTGGFDAGSHGGSDTDAPATAAGSADDGRGATSSFGGFSAGSLAGSAAGFGSGVGTPSAATAGSFSTGNGVQPTGAFVSSPAVPGQSATSPTGILDIGKATVFAYGIIMDEDAVAPAATLSDSDGGVKPVLVDLDGDGLEIAAADENFVLFDTDDTGLIHRTAWAGKGDRVLFFDADGDGTISAAREYIFTEWDPTAGGDMEALPAFVIPERCPSQARTPYPGSMPRRPRHAVRCRTGVVRRPSPRPAAEPEPSSPPDRGGRPSRHGSRIRTVSLRSTPRSRMTKAVGRHAKAEAVPAPAARPASFRKTNRAARGAAVRKPFRDDRHCRRHPAEPAADATERIPPPAASVAPGIRCGMTP